tara:strand:- start:1784 stop:2107 length:324 start_codon:yes stop_codon:yes gene_type:complete
MKNTINVRFTDEQFYFLQEIAKDQHRTLEELLWLLIEDGYSCFAEQHSISVDKRDNEFTDEEKEKMKKWDSGMPEQREGNYVQRFHDRDKIEEVLSTIPSNIMEFRK